MRTELGTRIGRIATVVAACAMLGILTTAQADTTALIDWSNASSAVNPDSNGNYWTTVGITKQGLATATSANLISSDNGTTPWDVTVNIVNASSGFGGTGINGNTGPAPFDQSFAVIDGIFSGAAGTATVATITFADLKPNRLYRFSAIGGRASNQTDGTITVTTGTGTGGTLKEDGTILDFNVTSDASGTIGFTFSVYGATFNALSITEAPAGTVIMIQ